MCVIFSYHQKYLLRNQRGLSQSLELDDKQLITSYVACKLNGYVAGYGDEDQFDKVRLIQAVVNVSAWVTIAVYSCYALLFDFTLSKFIYFSVMNVSIHNSVRQ